MNETLQNNLQSFFAQATTIVAELSYLPIHQRNKREWLPKTFDLSKFPKFIRHLILPQMRYGCQHTFQVTTIDISCSLFFCASDLLTLKRELNSLVIRKLVTWVNFAYTHKSSSSLCATTELVFYVYLLDLPKVLPVGRAEILNEKNANTGFTFACQEKGEVVVYRKEEWFKVLIHETFHALGLDFAVSSFESSSSSSSSSSTNRENLILLQTFASVVSDINLFEAYTETWAEIIALMFYCQYDHFFDAKKYKILWNEHLLFKIFQMIKILHHMDNMTYASLFEQKHQTGKYQEETNIFAYYVLTCILLFSADHFFTFCTYKNDDNDDDDDDDDVRLQFHDIAKKKEGFAILIAKMAKKKEFVRQVKVMEQVYMKLNSESNPNMFFKTTMRMTIFDV